MEVSTQDTPLEDGMNLPQSTSPIENSDPHLVVINEIEWKEVLERTRKLEKELKQMKRKRVHKGTTCDGCYPGDKTAVECIVGVRFKCLECENFDLCSICEEKGVESGVHESSHNMAKIKEPLVKCFWCTYSFKCHRSWWQIISAVIGGGGGGMPICCPRLGLGLASHQSCNEYNVIGGHYVLFLENFFSC